MIAEMSFLPTVLRDYVDVDWRASLEQKLAANYKFMGGVSDQACIRQHRLECLCSAKSHREWYDRCNALHHGSAGVALERHLMQGWIRCHAAP